MNIAIFGTGVVGQTLAASLDDSGHSVFIGTRDVKQTLQREEVDAFGNPPFKVWLKDHTGVDLLTFKEAAEKGDIIINATAGSVSLSALEMAKAENLSGKILIDLANPLDFSEGFPPTLTICNDDSLGEQIQESYPDARVVKTLNTMNCEVMVAPDLIPGSHNVFMSGNDTSAKEEVAEYLYEWFGWEKENIMDLGDITTSRGTEMMLPIWIRLYRALDNHIINFHIVKGSPQG